MSVTGYKEFEILDGTRGRDLLGESPWWSVADQALYSVDIFGHKVYRSTLDGASTIEVDAGREIGFVVPSRFGGLVLGMRDGLYGYDVRTRAFYQLTRGGYDERRYRLNDGKTDRRGRLWYGTIHDLEIEGGGALYRYDERGVSRMKEGVVTSNGIGWSPDDRVMYFTDSMTLSIMAFGFDETDGAIAGGREFVRDTAGRPDGLTVDADGCVWSAKFEGGRVVRYRSDGSVCGVVELPVSRPTSCMFVGADLSVLAVTSASFGADRGEPLAGSTFLVQTDTHGIPEVPCGFPVDAGSRGPVSAV